MNSQPDDGIVYLSVNDLYNINEEVTGALPYVRDRHLLRSAAQRPRLALFGQPQFPTLLEKAAAIMHSLAYHHLFADGNKRTAARATNLFLSANGVRLAVDAATQYNFILEVAQGEKDVADIVVWLQTHTENQTG